MVRAPPNTLLLPHTHRGMQIVTGGVGATGPRRVPPTAGRQARAGGGEAAQQARRGVGVGEEGERGGEATVEPALGVGAAGRVEVLAEAHVARGSLARLLGAGPKRLEAIEACLGEPRRTTERTTLLAQIVRGED
jgi:hypothetical protein